MWSSPTPTSRWTGTRRRGRCTCRPWHGTPLKHIHFDVLWAPPGRLEYLTQDVRRWDHLLSPNTASTQPLRGAFDFRGHVLETGYPRNDSLSSPQSADTRARVRRGLGIPDDKTGRPVHPDVARGPPRRRREAGLRAAAGPGRVHRPPRRRPRPAAAPALHGLRSARAGGPARSARRVLPPRHQRPVPRGRRHGHRLLLDDVRLRDHRQADAVLHLRPRALPRRAPRLLLRHRGGRAGTAGAHHRPARRCDRRPGRGATPVRRVVRALPQPVLSPRGRLGHRAGRGLAAGSWRHRRAGPGAEAAAVVV